MPFTHWTHRVQAFVLRALAASLCALGVSATAMAAEPMAAEATTQSAQRPAGFGAHGMAVFGGRDGLYASHLPMFHAPHHAQVLLRFHLADPSVDASLRARLALRPQLWTLDPEPFDLQRLQAGNADPIRQFGARFVQGHFERGGVQRFAKQTVVIDEVLLFKPLDALAASDAKLVRSAGSYLLLGAGREFFAVKEIDRRPDFDTIVAMKPLAHAKQVKSKGEPVRTQVRRFTVPVDGLKEPARATLQAALQAQSGGTLKVGKTLYFETEDLQ